MKLLKKFEEYVQDMMNIPTSINFNRKSGDEIRKDHEIEKGKVFVKYEDILKMNVKQFKEYISPFLDSESFMPQEGYEMLPDNLRKVYLKSLIDELMLILPCSQEEYEDWELQQLADSEKMFPKEFKKAYLEFVYDAIKSNDFEEMAYLSPNYMRLLSASIQMAIVRLISVYVKKIQFFDEKLYNAFDVSVKKYIDENKKIKVY